MLNYEICSNFGQELIPLVSYETQIAAQEPILGVVSFKNLCFLVFGVSCLSLNQSQVNSLREHTPLSIGSPFYVSETTVEMIGEPETKRNYLVRLASETNLVLGNSHVIQVTFSKDSKILQKETGKRKAQDGYEYDKSSNKKLITSNPPDNPMTQGFETVPSIGSGEGARDQDSGGGGSSGNSQTFMAHLRQWQLRFIERQRLNRNPSHALEVPRDGPLRSGPNSAGGEVGRDQDSIGAGSSVLPLREFKNQSLQRFLERRASRINQNPIQVPDVPQPLSQGGAIQPGGRGQGDLDLQGQFQQQGRGPGDQNRGRGNQNRGRGRRNQNRGRRGDQNRGRGQ